jgi:glutamate 5-kinase
MCWYWAELMQAWDIGFKDYALTSQVLLTYHNFSNPSEIENIRKCLLDDIENGIVPLVNYNDKVDWQEVAKDNDKMAADIAICLKASQLIILTSVDGLLNGEKVIKEIKLNEMEKYMEFCYESGKYGTGGFLTKLEAAKKVTTCGIECVIGNIKYKLKDIIKGKVPRTKISCG